MDWYCIRCKQDVDYKAFRCGCTESPSPWIEKYKVEFPVEKIEIKAGPRRLSEKWTVELQEPVYLYEYEPWCTRLKNKVIDFIKN